MGTITREELLVGLFEAIGVIIKESSDRDKIIARLRHNIEAAKIVDPTSAAYRVSEGILLVADPPKKPSLAEQKPLRLVVDDETD